MNSTYPRETARSLKFDQNGYLKAIEAINLKVPFDYVKSFILERNYEKLQEIKQNIAVDVDNALIQYANSANYAAINDLDIDQVYIY